MYDFAGWLGACSSKHSPNDLLNAMLGTTAEHQTGERYGVASGTSGRIGSTGPVTALLTGHPRWYEKKHAAAAELHGHGQVFAKLFLEKGPAALQQLGGDFALAVYDQEHSQGMLAIDRMGICPLAYTETPEGLVFGGDLQTLCRHPHIPAEPDPQALFAYLYFHMIPAPLSVYRGIKKLLPGQYLLWRPQELKSGFYWLPNFEDESQPEPELAEELRSVLKESVADSVTKPESTGAFLSGGLDSSTVTGLFKQLAPDTATAFSIGFSAEGYDEMDYARASAQHFGVPLHELYVTPHDVTDAIGKIAACYDEPFGNASAIPTYYCARLAREHGKSCLLAGDGGDELFAGNARYAKQKLFSLYEQIPVWLRSLVIDPVAASGIPGVGKVKRYVEQAKIPMPERMETYNFLHRTPLADIFEADFLASVDPGWPLEHLREIYDRPQASMLKRMLWLDWKITLADNDLHKVNRMGKLAGVEIRYPLLEDPVVKLAARVPDHLLMRGFELRSFYRRAFCDFLAPATLKKTKHGFGLPFGLWLRSDPGLQELAYTSLAHPALSGRVKKTYIHSLKAAHQHQHASYYGVMIWILMMWSQWAEHHQG